MRRLTIALQYYDNPEMLRLHQRVWRHYHPDIRDRMEVVVVDDASPGIPAELVIEPPVDYFLRLYRVKEDRPWHQNGARNLAMKMARDGWCLVTDIDHLLMPRDADALWTSDLRAGSYYVPARRKPDGTPIRPHPNTYVLERETFWKVGGTYEEFCGFYGTDSVFRRRLQDMAEGHPLPGVTLTVYNMGGEDIGGVEGAGTRAWGRKGTQYHSKQHPRLRRLMKDAHLRPPAKVCDFEWERVL